MIEDFSEISIDECLAFSSMDFYKKELFSLILIKDPILNFAEVEDFIENGISEACHYTTEIPNIERRMVFLCLKYPDSLYEANDFQSRFITCLSTNLFSFLPRVVNDNAIIILKSCNAGADKDTEDAFSMKSWLEQRLESSIPLENLASIFRSCFSEESGVKVFAPTEEVRDCELYVRAEEGGFNVFWKTLGEDRLLFGDE